MPSSLPISLLAAWIIFTGSVNTHQRHAANFRGASPDFAATLEGSTVLGTLVGLGLLIYYFSQVSWYWPLVLFAVGIITGGLAFGWLDAKIGQPGMSFLAFVGWPAGALWAFLVIRSIAV